MKSSTKILLLDLFSLTLFIGIFYYLFLGSYALFTPDEARYAEISREMLQSGSYIIPHLNGIIYLEKPILFYWLKALFFHFFGLSELTVRLPTTTIALFGSLTVYYTGIKLYSRTAGIYAAVILSTSLLYFFIAHAVTIDMTFSVLLSISLIAFLLGDRETNHNTRKFYMWTTAAFAALSLLTKGLIGVVFPVLIIGVWVTLLKKWGEWKKWSVPSSALLFLIIALPWHLLAQWLQPKFFNFYFIEQQFLRYSTMMAKRYEPFYYFFGILILGFLPWTAFLIQSIYYALPFKRSLKNQTFKQPLKIQEANLFLLLWAGIIFIFFSLSHSKLPPYILPIFPPLALLIGHYFAETKKAMSLKMGFFLLNALYITASFLLLIAPYYFDIANPVLAKKMLFILACMLPLTALISTIVFYFHSFKTAFITITLGTAFSLFTVISSIQTIDNYSIKPLANYINQYIKKGDEIVCFQHYYQDLPFYTKRCITMVDVVSEFAFGMSLKKSIPWVMSSQQFWKHLKNTKHRIFIVTPKENLIKLKNNPYHLKICKLAETQKNLLLDV